MNNYFSSFRCIVKNWCRLSEIMIFEIANFGAGVRTKTIITTWAEGETTKYGDKADTNNDNDKHDRNNDNDKGRNDDDDRETAWTETTTMTETTITTETSTDNEKGSNNNN